ncbi:MULTISPECIES: hypothetical protein [Xanthomonas]|uniref:Uncharacterized protein n=1 Tax=Xanthomonas axonopodis pv. melhusii TaxID=487834 RepID=A0A1T1P9Q5_9XANT|nr:MULTISPECIES: hypothetical protein [Xanthomonas]OOW85588.1 hypothetical protein Xvtf_16310 [Xanthomonas campestris pv. vitistrifoliae]MBE0315432.1 hypothetical protein [Xanthomonas citri pv. punicae]MDS0760597.1 hypothetical protein [Xanthomonas citri pv. punicae]MDS0764374.1 hypothetical protein [Xanthomonas citri pv. punicae]MDS0799138.1 hypothetical protein [Xanthomonas citri pv. punicae]
MQSKDVQARDADGDPIYQKNPHPKQAYRVTMTIADAPGPFGVVSGTAFYDMTNRDECAPFDPALGMSTKPKEDAIPVAFHRVDDTAYMAMVYTDGMIDADYYGKGICHWEFGGIGVSLKATGSSAETAFAPSLERKYFDELSQKTTFFWLGGYPKSKFEGYVDFGEELAEKYAEPNRSNLFRITLSAERLAP